MVTWHGCFPVMLTPFDEAGAIDLPGLHALIDWYLDHGAGGLFACCQSSEIAHLGWEERLWLARRTVERVAGRVPVVAAGTIGIGDPAAEAAALRALAATGVDAVVVITGHIIAPRADDDTAEAALAHLADLCPGLALGLYECPRPYKRLLTPAMVSRLARDGRWRYYKETSCVAATCAAKAQACAGTPLAMFDACIATLGASLAAGAAGSSPILANLVPEAVAQYCAQPEAELGRALARLALLIEDGYPQAVKQALAASGVPIGPRCRAPSSPATPGQVERLIAAVQALRADHALVSLR